MRINEILTELKMSPSSLMATSTDINATVGIEYELVVPGDESMVEYENDFAKDDPIGTIDAVLKFYAKNRNDQESLTILKRQLISSYNEWFYDTIDSTWDFEKNDIIDEYVHYHFKNAQDEQKQQAIQQIKNENSEIYKKLYKEFADEYTEDYYTQFQPIWFRQNDIRWMSGILPRYNINWPMVTAYSGGIDTQTFANEYQSVVNKTVRVSSSYHSTRRDGKSYIIEPDDSIRPANDMDVGQEIISPPLEFQEALHDLKATVEWLKSKGCYTNQSCGLHINVSIPSYNLDNLDYVKLALFTGDKHILKQFGRLGNTYAYSALDKIRMYGEIAPDKALMVMQSMQKNLSNFANKVIHGVYTSHEASINVHEDYVEFRHAGGDWLNADIDDLIHVITRFIVALDVACDPKKNQQEYAKKLYKIIDPESEYKDSVKVFAQYSAGLINRNQLKNQLKKVDGEL